jgi:hypothetical protein
VTVYLHGNGEGWRGRVPQWANKVTIKPCSEFATDESSSVERNRRTASAQSNHVSFRYPSPPSKGTHPLTQAPALEARKMHAPATSSGLPILPSGTPPTIVSRAAAKVAAITARAASVSLIRIGEEACRWKRAPRRWAAYSWTRMGLRSLVVSAEENKHLTTKTRYLPQARVLLVIPRFPN